jgi:hypothetical protein
MGLVTTTSAVHQHPQTRRFEMLQLLHEFVKVLGQTEEESHRGAAGLMDSCQNFAGLIEAIEFVSEDQQHDHQYL